MTTSIRIQDVTKRFGAATAVDAVALDIAAGELFFLLGPSGCGKSTLLRMLAGFATPDAGDIYFGAERITALPPRARNAAMVFQAYALWPHMSVADNVGYGLKVRGLPRKEIADRVERALRLVRMEGFGQRRPTQLSGGQQQRVALARAVVVEPRVLLLDEPLSNLDARLRDEMRQEIHRLHGETGLTMVYVTHDQKEALTLANRLAVMNQGKLAQVGSPREVYDRPANRFVAQFLGDSNFISGTVRECDGGKCVVETAVGSLTGVPTEKAFEPGTEVVCSIRPHALRVDRNEAGFNTIPARLRGVTFLGDLLHLEVVAAGDLPLQVVSLPADAGRFQPGDALILSVPPDQVVVLPPS